MFETKLRIIVLSHGGAEHFLELLSRLPGIEIAGVFIETGAGKRRSVREKIARSIRYDGYFATLKKFTQIFFAPTSNTASPGTGQDDLIKWITESGIPLFAVANYHSAEALKLLREMDADLAVLYGTNIVKDSVFAIPRLGSINIHQGLAPLYRGGPTVFWELFNDEKEIGITVHFVAAKVDTGDIILQTTIPMDYDFFRYGLDYEGFLRDFRASLAEPSARLLVEAIRQIAVGETETRKQQTNVGKRYKLPVKSEKDQLLRVLKNRQKLRLS